MVWYSGIIIMSPYLLKRNDEQEQDGPGREKVIYSSRLEGTALLGLSMEHRKRCARSTVAQMLQSVHLKRAYKVRLSRRDHAQQ